MAAVGPLLSSIRADVPLSFSSAALLTMLPVMAMGLAMFFGMGLAKRWGEHRSIVLSLLVIGVATLSRLFLDSALELIVSAIAGGILAGPALAGMYDTVLRALRDEAGYWWTTYRRAFRQNFKASILPGILYCVVVTVQIFLVYFCFNMLYHGTNVGVPMWVATVLNLVLFHMLFSYMWPQIVLLDQPLRLTLKNSLNCMIAFLPHALAAALVTILFWGLVILCMPLGLLLMLVFGFWFQCEICCQIVYGDLNRVFHIEESIQKLHDAQLEKELRAERGEDTPEE